MPTRQQLEGVDLYVCICIHIYIWEKLVPGSKRTLPLLVMKGKSAVVNNDHNDPTPTNNNNASTEEDSSTTNNSNDDDSKNNKDDRYVD